MIPSEGSLHLHSPTLSYVVEDLNLFDAIRRHGNKADHKMTLDMKPQGSEAFSVVLRDQNA